MRATALAARDLPVPGGAVTPIARAAPACLTNRPEPGLDGGRSQIFGPGRGAGLPEVLAGNEQLSAGLL